MMESLYLQGGRLLVDGGALKCGCCGGGDPDPPWVCPDCFPGGGPNGPDGPNNPDGDPRCCSGDTICSPVDDEPLYLGYQLNGSVESRYSWSSGPNSGQILTSSGNWQEIVVEQSAGSACEIGDSFFTTFTMPFRSQNATQTEDRVVRLNVSNIRWDRERGFFGGGAGNGSGVSNRSGIAYTLENMPGAGTHNVAWYLCRTQNPAGPPITAINDLQFAALGFSSPFDVRFDGQTTPSNFCLNKIVAEYVGSFVFGSEPGIGVTGAEHTVTLRIYAFVAGLKQCLIV